MKGATRHDVLTTRSVAAGFTRTVDNIEYLLFFGRYKRTSKGLTRLIFPQACVYKQFPTSSKVHAVPFLTDVTFATPIFTTTIVQQRHTEAFFVGGGLPA